MHMITPKRRNVHRQHFVCRPMSYLCRTWAGSMSIGVITGMKIYSFFKRLFHLAAYDSGTVDWTVTASANLQVGQWPGSLALRACIEMRLARQHQYSGDLHVGQASMLL